MGKPRIVLADDDGDFLHALQSLLTSEFDIVASVGDGHALIGAAVAHKPDLIVTDISMPLLSGLRATRQLRRDSPNIPIVFLTIREEPAFVAEAQKLGVSGYVVKRSAASDLILAMRTVLQGGSFISADLRRFRSTLGLVRLASKLAKRTVKTRNSPSCHHGTSRISSRFPVTTPSYEGE